MHSDDQRKVMDAAVRCFERYGPQRTSMTDIAEEAGISRRTLYRVFDDRSTLVEAILNDRLFDLAGSRSLEIATLGSVEECIVEGSLRSIELGEADDLFSEIVTHEHDTSVERFLLRVTDGVRGRVARAWAPLIERCRAEGRLREGLSDDRVVDLVMTVQTVVLMRDNLGRDGRRALLRDLLVPAILTDRPAA
ncbi:MAG: helix-turn-helix domain-containing protein [Actinomycetota bacterium]